MGDFIRDFLGLHRPTAENVLRNSAVDQANLRVQIQQQSDRQQREVTRYRETMDEFERRRLKASIMGTETQLVRLRQRLRDSANNSDLVSDMQASITDARAMRDGQTVLANQAQEFTDIAASINVQAARRNVRNIQRSQRQIASARQTLADLAMLHRESVDQSNEDAEITREEDEGRFEELSHILDGPSHPEPRETQSQFQLSTNSSSASAPSPASSALESRFRELGINSAATATKSNGRVMGLPSGAKNTRAPP